MQKFIGYKKKLQRWLTILAFLFLLPVLALKAPLPGLLEGNVEYLRYLPKDVLFLHLGLPKKTHEDITSGRKFYIWEATSWPFDEYHFDLCVEYEIYNQKYEIKSITSSKEKFGTTFYYNWDSPLFSDHPVIVSGSLQ